MAGHLAAQEVCGVLISTINECRVSSEGRCQHLNKLLRSMPLLRLDCGVEQHLCAAGSPCREEDPAGADQQASLQLYIRDRVQVCGAASAGFHFAPSRGTEYRGPCAG